MPGQVVANGPINFSDAKCRALSIPLSILYFDDTGEIKADRWPLYTANKALLDDWLPYLKKQGLISEGKSPAPEEAMVINAKTPGSAGNAILLNISNLHPDPADNTITLFDAAVSETNTYAGLTPATLKAVLGTSAGGGSKPGPVFVSSGGAPGMPKAGKYPLTGGKSNVAATVDIPNADDSATAFSVTARTKGAESNNTSVSIEQVDTAASTFTLVAQWTKSATNLKTGDLASSFDYEITVAPPASGTLSVPAPGQYALSGGADAQDARPASITLTAKP